tara:strand:+ start:132 stop:530 length:399 start_codon:yes stop_codon:yes gene_type:complete
MPVYKTLILNKEISLNYENNQKQKLEESVKAINHKLKTIDNLNGKISDNKLLSFLAIKLQAEIFDLNQKKQNDNNLEKKFSDYKNENISLSDKLHKLREQNKLLHEENESIKGDIDQIQNQINILINLLKKI